MSRPSTTRALAVWMNAERVGIWLTQHNKPDEFSYAEKWLATAGARPISLSLSLQPTPFRGDIVTAYFDNLLPDNQRIRERLQRRFGTRSTRPFDLLAEIGRDCIGAIQLLPEGEPPSNVHKIEGVSLTARGIERLLVDMLGTPIGQADESETFRISLAGAQEENGAAAAER